MDESRTVVMPAVVPGDDDPTWMRPAAPPQPWLAMGAVVGHHRIVSLLGVTPLAEIFLGEHVDPGVHLDALIKVMSAAPPERAAGVRSAVRALARVNHPGVIEVLHLGETSDGRPCVSLALHRDESLRTLRERLGPMPSTFAAPIVDQLADALAAIHAAGLVVGDLTSDRVLIRLTPSGPRALLVSVGAATLDLEPSAELVLDVSSDRRALHVLAAELTAGVHADLDRTVIVARPPRWPVLVTLLVTLAIVAAAVAAGWR